MATACIKCPKCGYEFYVIPEDLDRNNLIYECSNCKEEITVDFFDYCPTCNKIVGFLEGGAFKNDMTSLGMTIAKGVINPFSAVGTIGKMLYDGVVNESRGSLGNGICPYCNQRFIKCYSCHELTSIPQDATFESSFKCRSCGVHMNPNGSVDDNGKYHSKAYLNHKNEENMTPKNSNSYKQFHFSINSVIQGADNKVYIAGDFVAGRVSVGDMLVLEVDNHKLPICPVIGIVNWYRDVDSVTEDEGSNVQICVESDYEKIKDAFLAYNLYENGGKCFFNSELLEFAKQANNNDLMLLEPGMAEFEMIELHKDDIMSFTEENDFVSDSAKVAFRFLISLYALYFIYRQIEGNKQEEERNHIYDAIKISTDALKDIQTPSTDYILHREEFNLIMLLNELIANHGTVDKITSIESQILELKTALNDNNTFLPIIFWKAICSSLIGLTGISPKGYSSDGTLVYGHDEHEGKTFRMTVEDVFHVKTDNGEMCILTGCIENGVIHTDDVIYLNGKDSACLTTVMGIEIFRKFVPYAEKGDNVGIVISPDFENIVFKGMIVSSDEIVSSNSMENTANEQEYLNSIREFLEDDAEITPRERKMLDRIRQSLGISEERAKELEASLSKPQLTEDEQEYIEAYRDYLVDGSIDEKSRKRLDIFRKGLGISEERAKELEKTIK